jgi:hypothetical protein
MSGSYGVKEDTGTAVAVPDTTDTARYILAGIVRRDPLILPKGSYRDGSNRYPDERRPAERGCSPSERKG